MSDFHDFEDEFADEKIQADIASDNKQVRADAIERLARKTFDGGNLTKAVVFLETVSDRTRLAEKRQAMKAEKMQSASIASVPNATQPTGLARVSIPRRRLPVMN